MPKPEPKTFNDKAIDPLFSCFFVGVTWQMKQASKPAVHDVGYISSATFRLSDQDSVYICLARGKNMNVHFRKKKKLHLVLMCESESNKRPLLCSTFLALLTGFWKAVDINAVNALLKIWVYYAR